MKEQNATKHGEELPPEGRAGVRPRVLAMAERLVEARCGRFEVALTAHKAVPTHWFASTLKGRKILCLAGESGAEGHILAAAGAQVTIFSHSEKRLEGDNETSAKEDLKLATMLGELTNLSVFPNGCFDLVFCPATVPHVPGVRRFFWECGRILKHGGVLMMGVSLPCLLDGENGAGFYIQADSAKKYSHTLEELIGGQIEAGMVIIGFYEDTDEEAICDYIPCYFATRALKI